MLLVESSFNTKNIIEEGDTGKKMYVEGTFLQAEIVNRNKRIYPKSVMESAVQMYLDEYVSRNMGASELEHPNTMQINPDRIAGRILKIEEREPNNYWGKALIVDTQCGRTARGLIEGGFQLGMSSRASGSVKESSSGVAIVQPDLKLVAVDLVMQPSGPDCYVQGIMESSSPFWNTIEEYADANLIESYRKEMQKMTVSQLHERKVELFTKFMDTITAKR